MRRLATPFVCLFALSGLAQEKDLPPAKLKAAGIEAAKKAGLKDPRTAESEHLILVSPLADARGKAVVDSMEKTYASAHKALRFEKTEGKEPKITVYLFTDLDQYNQFSRTVLKKRPEGDESAAGDLKAEMPFLAVSVRRGDRNPNFESLTGTELSKALLAKRGGNARLTEWMKHGFARAVQMRLNPSTASADRAAVRRMAPRVGKGAKGVAVADRAWMGTGRERDLIAASLMDFLTYGTGNDKLGGILAGLTPSDTAAEPTIAMALEGASVTLDEFDRLWRDWLAAGAQAGK